MSPTSLLGAIPPPPLRGDDGLTTFDIGPLSIAAYGVLIAVGAYLALRLLVRRYGELGGDVDLAERAALVALAAAIVGARIGYTIPRWERFLANPLEIPQVWQGGLAFFGGVALAVPVTWWYVRRRGGDITSMIDAAAPALPLGHAIGRWGNYFNQELYGRPTDLPWALEIEPHRRVAGFGDVATFHPTFLYESLWNLALVGVLLWVDGRRDADGRRRLRRGSLGFLYLVGYGIGRFWTELLRIDTAERYLGLSRNNWIALLVIVVGLVGVVWWERRGREADGPHDEQAPAPDEAAASSPDEDPATTDEQAGATGDDQAGATGDDVATGRDVAGPATDTDERGR